jgi:nucleoside triphosphate diphosphatase
MSEPEPRYSVEDLLRVMERLRDPETGCPWDVAQTFESIVPSTLEECYELAEAIELEDYPHVAEELGDVLFQVIFYAQLGRERELFEFGDVVHTLVDKLLRRHPHVFHQGLLEGVVQDKVSVARVKESWENIKRSERNAKKQSGVLDDVPLALPALPRAQKLQKRAAGVGFDWPSSEGAIAKLGEELAELNEAVASGEADAIEDEMGDILFTCVNLARHLGVDSETSLRRSSSKFEARFRQMEALVLGQGSALDQLDDAALDALWEEAKLSL